MATRCLWSSRAAKCLKILVLQRSFSTAVKDLKYVSAHEEMKVNGKENAIPKKNKAIIKTFKHLGKDGIWIVGSNIYLVDEEEKGNTSDSRCIMGKRTDNRRLAKGFAFKIDNRKGTILKMMEFNDKVIEEHDRVITGYGVSSFT